MSVPALALAGIAKRFGSAVALRDAAIAVRWGTVHALLGENGAGKTTLMRIAFGMTRPDAGRVEIDGRTIAPRTPADAIAAGVGMVHQHFTNVPAMTVSENVALGGHGRFDARTAAARVAALAAASGLRLDPDVRAEELTVGAQQRLEILKALARDARILILDEPTAVLAPPEARELLAWLAAFAARGNAAVLITHKLQEALSVAHEVTVLRQGSTVLHRPADEVTAPTLARAMVGEDLPPESVVPLSAPGDVVIAADALTIEDEHGIARVRGATFALRRGEILGIAGVEGAGQHHLLRAMAGRLEPTRGRLMLPQRIGFVPEDRHRDALVLDFSLTENVMLKDAGMRRGRLRGSAWRAHTAEVLERFAVRPANPRARARELSGGNQQRLVLARELADQPEVLVVENPTRGLDVRATWSVLQRLREAAAGGVAVVFYSSDLDEVLAVSTRVLALHAGTAKEVPRDRAAVSDAMLGVS